MAKNLKTRAVFKTLRIIKKPPLQLFRQILGLAQHAQCITFRIMTGVYIEAKNYRYGSVLFICTD